MNEYKVVVHRADGTILKGITHDFQPGVREFHLLPAEGGGVPQRVALDEIKGVFFVRDWLGNREYDPPPGFGPAPVRGRRAVVTFEDGEVIHGSTPDFDESAPGFTLYPSDPEDNNVRIWVSARAVRSIEFPDPD
ncbi:MAG: hypothetical protein Kow0062_18730 [Acidobacteriota bacterium]